MKTETNNTDNITSSKAKKTVIFLVAFVGVIAIGGLIASMFLTTTVDAKDKPEILFKVEEWGTTYQAIVNERNALAKKECESIKEGSRLKMSSAGLDLIAYLKTDLDRWEEQKNRDCSNAIYNLDF